MIQLSITDRDGGELRVEEYETVEALLSDWPNAECRGDYWEAWVGGKN